MEGGKPMFEFSHSTDGANHLEFLYYITGD
jgi:hypothetical protein